MKMCVRKRKYWIVFLKIVLQNNTKMKEYVGMPECMWMCVNLLSKITWLWNGNVGKKFLHVNVWKRQLWQAWQYEKVCVCESISVRLTEAKSNLETDPVTDRVWDSEEDTAEFHVIYSKPRQDRCKDRWKWLSTENIKCMPFMVVFTCLLFK